MTLVKQSYSTLSRAITNIFPLQFFTSKNFCLMPYTTKTHNHSQMQKKKKTSQIAAVCRDTKMVPLCYLTKSMCVFSLAAERTCRQDRAPQESPVAPPHTTLPSLQTQIADAGNLVIWLPNGPLCPEKKCNLHPPHCPSAQ
jgi:hypothetical protein